VIRVLHLQGPSNWGGNLEGIRTLSRAMDSTRFQPILGGPASSGYLAKFEADGIETADIPWTSRWDARGMHRLHQVLRRRGIDLIHSHVRLTDWLGGAGSRMIGLPCVSSLHAPFQYANDLTPLRDGSLPLHGWVLRNLVDHVITVSSALRDDAIRLLKLSPDRVTHVINGIDPQWGSSAADPDLAREHLSLPPRSPVLLHVGWFGPRKGQMDLINALPQVLEQVESACCVFVGEGKLWEQCKERVRELGVSDSVRFLGFRDDVSDLMSAADVVVLPSYSEGLPRVLLEAGLMGKPVVSTRVDGIKELVIEGETGVLVEAGDHVALAEAMVVLLCDPDRAERMGDAARLRVLTSFSSHQMARETEEIYCRILAQRRVMIPMSASVTYR